MQTTIDQAPNGSNLSIIREQDDERAVSDDGASEEDAIELDRRIGSLVLSWIFRNAATCWSDN